MAWLHKAMLVNLIIRGVINDELHSKRSKSRCGGVYTLRQQNLAGGLRSRQNTDRMIENTEYNGI